MTEEETQYVRNEINDILIDNIDAKCYNTNIKCKYLYDRLNSLEKGVRKEENRRIRKEILIGFVLSVALLIYNY